jgi:hypothetical protein
VRIDASSYPGQVAVALEVVEEGLQVAVRHSAQYPEVA